jgi:prepilin-type N-terminal cleavage/methylation domain-containing protein
MVEHGQRVQIDPGGKMFQKIKIDLAAVTFDLHRLLLAVTIWSCHAWVAPIFRLCHGFAAAIFGLQDIFIDRRRITATVSKDKTSACSSHGVLSSLILRSSSAKTKYSELRTTYSELSDSRPRVTLIQSIPRIWDHGVKQPMGQGETPNPELLPSRSALAKAGRTPNFKGFTLIEVIAVMIVIGILAATVLSRIDFGTTSSRASADGAAYMIASDIRYAQEFAMANRISKSIVFTNGSSSYTFSPTSTGMDPSGQLQSIGATIGTTVTFTFNSLGEPTAGGGNSVTVSSGGQSRTITVTQYTGKVSIS